MIGELPDLLIFKRRSTEKVKENLHSLVHFPNGSNFWTRVSPTQESGTPSGSFMWVVRGQTLGPPFAIKQGTAPEVERLGFELAV